MGEHAVEEEIMDGKRIRVVIGLTARLVAVSLLALAFVWPPSLAAHAVGIVRYARPGGLTAGSCTSWSTACALRYALNTVAVSGDQLWVAKGTHKPAAARAATFRLKSGVAVYGGFVGTETALRQRNWKANVTVLSGEIGAVGIADNSYHVVTGSGVDRTAILDGFTITRGNANGATFGPDSYGGGMYIAGGNPTLRDLVFSSNSADYAGGGMYNSGGPALTNLSFINNSAAIGGGMFQESRGATLTNTTFTSNSARNSGGGMYNHSVISSTLSHVSFTENSAGYGGGIFSDVGSRPTLIDVAFSGNAATYDGGGVFNGSGSTPAVTRVALSGNSAERGAGMFNEESSPRLVDVVFRGNSALYGGGMFNDRGSSPSLTNVKFTDNVSSNSAGGMDNEYSSSPTLTNVTFYRNSGGSGGGMYSYYDSNPKLTNVTFSANSGESLGGAMYNAANSPTLTNVTFSGNSAVLGGAMYNDGSNPSITNSLFWNDSSEVRNADSTPSIIDSIVQGGCPTGSVCNNVGSDNPKLGPIRNNGGFTATMALGAGSPAIDAGGINAACAAWDQRGVARPQGLRCDMGAYEVRAMTFVSAAAYDGWLLESTETSGVGGSAYSADTTVRVGDDNANQQLRTILSFNTAALPDAATVVLGRLRLRSNGVIIGTDPFTTHGPLLLDLSKPYFGSELALLPSDFQAAPTLNAAGVVSPQLVGGVYMGRLISTAYPLVNKTGTTQLRLRFKLDDNNDHDRDFVVLYSGDATITADRPRLIVYYNP